MAAFPVSSASSRSVDTGRIFYLRDRVSGRRPNTFVSPIKTPQSHGRGLHLAVPAVWGSCLIEISWLPPTGFPGLRGFGAGGPASR